MNLGHTPRNTRVHRHGGVVDRFRIRAVEVRRPSVALQKDGSRAASPKIVRSVTGRLVGQMTQVRLPSSFVVGVPDRRCAFLQRLLWCGCAGRRMREQREIFWNDPKNARLIG